MLRAGSTGNRFFLVLNIFMPSPTGYNANEAPFGPCVLVARLYRRAYWPLVSPARLAAVPEAFVAATLNRVIP